MCVGGVEGVGRREKSARPEPGLGFQTSPKTSSPLSFLFALQKFSN